MRTNDDGHASAGVAALAERAYERAGDAFTRAAWRVLAEPRPERNPFDADDRGWVGDGLRWFVTAAVAYRVAGRDARATRRGVEGVAVAGDLKTALDGPAQAACLAEFAADCRVAGGLDDADDAYGTAVEAYHEAGDAVDDPHATATTPLFQAAAAPIRQVARGLADGEIAIDWDDLHGSDPSDPGRFLARRATYKRRRFRSLLERAVDAGHLAAPRGTTAYDEAGHRCPRCDANDVNWIADAVLCLRCSTPMERG